MRKIKYIVIHCTATSQKTTVASIINYWRNTLKWKSAGYHFIYQSDGSEIQLQDINKIANGVANYNSESIHLSYIGGIDSKGKSIDNRTDSQKESMLYRILQLKKQFPSAKILGHRDFPKVAKDCPCFNAIEEFKNITTL